MKKKKMKKLLKQKDRDVGVLNNSINILLKMMGDMEGEAVRKLTKIGIMPFPLDMDKVERIKRSMDSGEFWKNAGRVNNE